MRYVPILLVIFLAGCPVPPKKPTSEQAPPSEAAPVTAPAAWPVTLPPVEVVAPKYKVVKPAKPPDAVEHNPCSGIVGEDVKEGINLKLDCIENELK